MVSWLSRKQETELERKLREALADERWGVSNALLLELSDFASAPGASAPGGDRGIVLSEVWAALSDRPARYSRINRGLSLVEFLIKNAATEVVDEIRGSQMKVRALLMFDAPSGGQDVGASIREKARSIVDLLNNSESLEAEREKSKTYRSKFVGMGSGAAAEGAGSAAGAAGEPSAAAGGVFRDAVDSAGGFWGKLASSVSGGNRNETEVQRKLREALSTDKWGVPNTQLLELCDAAESLEDRAAIMEEVWAAVQDKPARWSRIVKGLTLLEALVKNAVSEVVDEVVGKQMKIRALMMFEYTSGGKDSGAGVREKAKTVIDLVNDPKLLAAEREKARSNRGKFVGFANDGSAAVSAPTSSKEESAGSSAAAGDRGSAGAAASAAAGAKAATAAPAPAPAAPAPAPAPAPAVAPVAAAPARAAGGGWGSFEAPSTEKWSAEVRGLPPTANAAGVPRAAAPAAAVVDLLDMEVAPASSSSASPAPAAGAPAAPAVSSTGLDFDFFSPAASVATAPATAAPALTSAPAQAPAPALALSAAGAGGPAVSSGLQGLDLLGTGNAPAAPSAVSSLTKPGAGLMDLDPMLFAGSAAPPQQQPQLQHPGGPFAGLPMAPAMAMAQTGFPGAAGAMAPLAASQPMVATASVNALGGKGGYGGLATSAGKSDLDLFDVSAMAASLGLPKTK